MHQPYRASQDGSRSLSQARVLGDMVIRRFADRIDTTRSSCGAARSAASCRRKFRDSFRPMYARKLSVIALEISNGSGDEPGFFAPIDIRTPSTLHPRLREAPSQGRCPPAQSQGVAIRLVSKGLGNHSLGAA
jgi:hypothetical protein